MYYTREEILKKFWQKIMDGEPIIGTGAGIGLSAKCEEVGGTDLIIVYNSGWHRMNGRPSNYGNMPLGDANSFVMEMAVQILPVVKHTPVIAGVYAHDTYKFMKLFLRDLKEVGFSGIQNFPSVGTLDGTTKEVWDSVGVSYEKEVDLVKLAHEMDLLTTPYCYTTEHAEKMAAAGADIIVAHCRMTVGGWVGLKDEETMSLEAACKLCQDIHDAAVAVNPDVLVICHGGPINMPEDVDYLLHNTKGIVGFYGASSAERIPVEKAITEHIARYKAIRL